MPLHRGVGVEGHMLLSRSFVCLKKHTQHCIYWEIEGSLLCCFRIERPPNLVWWGIFMHQSYHGKGNQNWGTETSVYQDEAGLLTFDKHWSISNHFLMYRCGNWGPEARVAASKIIRLAGIRGRSSDPRFGLLLSHSLTSALCGEVAQS